MPNEEMIHYKKCIFRETKEHTVDCQLNLPDYYPDVCRILTCHADSYIENCKNQGDRITVDGITVFRLLYSSDDKSLHLFETEKRFTKTFECNDNNSTAIVECKFTNVNVNYRAIGPRRVDVKTNISVFVSSYELCALTVQADISDAVECLQKELELFDVTACYSDSFTVDEIFASRDERIAESKLLFESNRIQIQETKVVKDKILIKGYVELNCTFLHSKDCTVFKYNDSVAFSQIVDLYGVSEGDHCFVVAEAQRMSLSVKDAGECSIQQCVRIYICAGQEKMIQVAQDVFSPAYKLTTDIFDDKMQIGLRQFQDSFLCSEKSEESEYAQAQVLAVYENDIAYTVTMQNGTIAVNGKISAGILLHNGGELQYITRNMHFEYTKEVEPSKDGSVMCTISCKSLTCNITMQGLSLKAELDFCGIVLSEAQVNFVKEYKVGEELFAEKDYETISLYFAHSGETLWHIAKANKIPVQMLKDCNEISADVIENDCVLLLIGSEETV